MIGVGGMAKHWIHQVWHSQRERMTFAGLVDVNAEALHATGEALGVPANCCFTNTAEAFAQIEADYCCIVTPPQFHREAVALACGRGMAILSEKPIAHTWADCCAIIQAVKQAGVKMMVTQNYRYTQRILTLKKAVSELGVVNYAVCRYAADYREPLAWGAAFRHEMPHSLLIEASIHHFDQLRNLTSADCETLSGFEWHPGHIRGGDEKFEGSNSFKGETNGLYVLKMSGGSMAHYEGNNLATGKTNSWHSEYYRVECEGGAAVLEKDHIVRIEERGPSGTLKVCEVPTEKSQWEGHHAIGVQFLDWIDESAGGPQPATVLADNIKSAAMMFAAIESGSTGKAINVAEMVRAQA